MVLLRKVDFSIAFFSLYEKDRTRVSVKDVFKTVRIYFLDFLSEMKR